MLELVIIIGAGVLILDVALDALRQLGQREQRRREASQRRAIFRDLDGTGGRR